MCVPLSGPSGAKRRRLRSMPASESGFSFSSRNPVYSTVNLDPVFFLTMAADHELPKPSISFLTSTCEGGKRRGDGAETVPVEGTVEVV